MLSKHKTGWRIRFSLDGEQVQIYLPQTNKKTAEQVETRIRRIAISKASGTVMDAQDAAWLGQISDSLHAKIAARGIVAPREKEKPTSKRLQNFARVAERFMDDYEAAAGTIQQMNLAHGKFITFLEGRDLDASPIGELGVNVVKAFRSKLKRDGLAEASHRKVCSRCKQVFSFAKQEGLIEENPFDSIKVSAVANTEHERPVSSELVKEIISKLKCPHAKMTLALCRFGGFRYQETALTTWEDIDWDSGWITVRSSKTGSRQCPLFSSLRPYLEEVPPERRKGSLQARWQADANARTTLKKMIRDTGHEPWPKVLHILRKSRATELLQKNVPAHEVAKWLGHSLNVLQRWYALQSDENARKAMREL